MERSDVTQARWFSLRRRDWRTFGIMTAAALIGVAWAAYNFASAGSERGEEQLRPLVWTIFATPFALFLGWLVARRAEIWLAAFACFCFYFFTPFVAARIESLLMNSEQMSANKHSVYFQSVLWLHLFGSLALAAWRATRPVASGPPPDTPVQQTGQSADAA